MQLTELLTGKALTTYAAMMNKAAEDYDKVNRYKAVPNQYDVNEETYQQQFWQNKKRPEKMDWAWVCNASDDSSNRKGLCNIHD